MSVLLLRNSEKHRITLITYNCLIIYNVEKKNYIYIYCYKYNNNNKYTIQNRLKSEMSQTVSARCVVSGREYSVLIEKAALALALTELAAKR